LVLRGPRPDGGFAGLRDAVAVLDEERHAGSRARLLAWLDKIEARMAPFVGLMTAEGSLPFRDLLQNHIRMAESLAATLESDGAERLWIGEAGEAASRLLQDLLRAGGDIPDLAPGHYVPLLRMLMKGVTVRPRYGTHPRLSIMGQVE